MLTHAGFRLSEITETSPVCTQDNSGTISPSELATFMRETIRFAKEGGCVEVKLAPKLAGGLSTHAYWHIWLASMGGGIEYDRSNIHFQNETHLADASIKNEFSKYQKVFATAYGHLNERTVLGKTIREISLSSALCELNEFETKIREITAHLSPFWLIERRDIIVKGASLHPGLEVSQGYQRELIENTIAIHGSDGVDAIFRFKDAIKRLYAQMEAGLQQVIVEKEKWYDDQIKVAFEQLFNIQLAFSSQNRMVLMDDAGKNKTQKNVDNVNSVETLLMNFYAQFGEMLGFYSANKKEMQTASIEIQINNFEVAIERSYAHRFSFVDNYIKRLNTGLPGTKELSDILDLIQNEIKALNVSGLLKKVIEINSRNFYQIQLELRKIIELLEEIHVFLVKFPLLLQWKSFCDGLDINTRKILELLESLPSKQWVEIFDQALEKLCPGKLMHSLIPDNEWIIKNAIESHTSLWQFLAVQDIKAIIAMNQPMKETAPPSSFLKKMEGWVKGKPLEDLSKTSLISGKGQLKFTMSDDSGKEINFKMISPDGKIWKSQFEIDNIQMVENLAGISNRMDEIPLTERFGVAKTIAYFVLGLKSKVRVFQSKNANILCLLPSEISDLLVERFSNYGLKEFKGRTSVEDALIESLLETQRKQLLFLFNGLINDEDFSDIETQYLVLEKFKTIGFEMHSIWSKDIIKSENTKLWTKDLEALVKQ